MSHSVDALSQKWKLNSFEGKSALAEQLADDVCTALEAAIADRGSAVLAVSGGSTPKQFFNVLSSRPLDWQKVIVTLVDERWVDENSERSNARLVKENLLINQAAKARFVALYNSDENHQQAFGALESEVAKLPQPFDAVILGMGNDGHTASFFPGGDKLAAAVDPATKNLITFMRAEGAGELRVTFTLPVLINAGFLALHIEGADKMAVLEAAAGDISEGDEMPVRHVLRTANDLQIYWCN